MLKRKANNALLKKEHRTPADIRHATKSKYTSDLARRNASINKAKADRAIS